MKLEPAAWGIDPAVRLTPDAGDAGVMEQKLAVMLALLDPVQLEDEFRPDELDWLGRLVAKVETDKWRCVGAHVADGSV